MGGRSCLATRRHRPQELFERALLLPFWGLPRVHLGSQVGLLSLRKHLLFCSVTVTALGGAQTLVSGAPPREQLHVPHVQGASRGTGTTQHGGRAGGRSYRQTAVSRLAGVTPEMGTDAEGLCCAEALGLTLRSVRSH